LADKAGIKNSKGITAMLFLILTLTWAGYLYSQYNSTNQTLDLFGQELVLGEEEHESGSFLESKGHEDDDD